MSNNQNNQSLNTEKSSTKEVKTQPNTPTTEKKPQIITFDRTISHQEFSEK
jgi:hypothetical protein